MADPTPYTRRRFLEQGLVLASATATLPTFLSHTGSALAGQLRSDLSSLPGVPQDRVLVVVQLSGGNDGLNTVVPFGADAYHKARRGLAIGDALPLDDTQGIGLHPALRQFHELVGRGQAAAIQGVGYPNPNRSHFASMDVWHAGDTDAQGSRGVPTGWIGRALDTRMPKPGEQTDDPYQGLAAVAIGREAPSALRAKRARPVTFENANLYRWAPSGKHDALDQAYEALHDRPRAEAMPAAGAAAGPDARAFVYRTSLDARASSARIRRAVDTDPQTDFPNHGLARQLKTVAAMIRAQLPTRVYYVAQGGFDTHAGQAGRHQNLLRQFAQSMAAFQRELDATGHADRVTTFAFSEFGRRVSANASGGTDHGAAGPVFLMGDRVKAGLLGKHPSLTDLDRGDLKFNVDFRSIYTALLEDWLGVDAQAALDGRFGKPELFVKA